MDCRECLFFYKSRCTLYKKGDKLLHCFGKDCYFKQLYKAKIQNKQLEQEKIRLEKEVERLINLCAKLQDDLKSLGEIICEARTSLEVQNAIKEYKVKGTSRIKHGTIVHPLYKHIEKMNNFAINQTEAF